MHQVVDLIDDRFDTIDKQLIAIKSQADRHQKALDGIKNRRSAITGRS